MISESKEYNVRYSIWNDGDCLRQWLTDPETMKWYGLSEGKEIWLHIRNWISFFRYRAGLTATYEGKPCAMGILYLMPYKKIRHLANFSVIVGVEYRKQGVGTSMTKNLLNLAENYFGLESLYTEVFDESLFLKILKKLDFEEYAYQKHFVKDQNRYFARRIMGKTFR